METRYRIRRVVICLTLIALILIGLNVARAEYPPIEGGDVLAKVPCQKGGKQFLCVVVKVKDDSYMVLIDQKGEHSIYKSVKDKAVLVWSRATV